MATLGVFCEDYVDISCSTQIHNSKSLRFEGHANFTLRGVVCLVVWKFIYIYIYISEGLKIVIQVGHQWWARVIFKMHQTSTLLRHLHTHTAAVTTVSSLSLRKEVNTTNALQRPVSQRSVRRSRASQRAHNAIKLVYGSRNVSRILLDRMNITAQIGRHFTQQRLRDAVHVSQYRGDFLRPHGALLDPVRVHLGVVGGQPRELLVQLSGERVELEQRGRDTEFPVWGGESGDVERQGYCWWK